MATMENPDANSSKASPMVNMGSIDCSAQGEVLLICINRPAKRNGFTPKMYKELGEAIRAKINEDFKTYGLEVTKFYVENISLPEEVEKALDKRSSMGAIGNVGLACR